MKTTPVRSFPESPLSPLEELAPIVIARSLNTGDRGHFFFFFFRRLESFYDAIALSPKIARRRPSRRWSSGEAADLPLISRRSPCFSEPTLNVAKTTFRL